MENGDDSKYDDIELFFWETNNDDDDDDTTTTSTTTNNNDRNKYDFTFDSDDGDAILKEGELSDEEIRLKELYANGLASYKKSSSSSSSSSVTFGLDDIYDDNYGKEKTKRKKNNDNDWFGTYSNKKNVLDGTIDKGGSMIRGGRAEKFLADRSKKHPLSTPEVEAADGWSDEGLEEYDGLKDQ